MLIAGVLVLFSWLSATFPDVLEGPLSFGRIRPTAQIATILGWLTLVMIGGVYYLLPRLTGTSLWGAGLANTGFWLLATSTVAGMGLVWGGWGDGYGPLAIPLTLDAVIFVALLIPAWVTIGTVRRRTEPRVYVSLWFLMAGVSWLPLLYLAVSWPGLASIGLGLQEAILEAGFGVMWISTVGMGLVYFTVPKILDRPLASRPLALIGFWSLALASVWAGPLRYIYGPTADWVDSTAAVMTLALPLAAITVVVNLALTIGESRAQLDGYPGPAAAMSGAWLMVLFTTFAALSGFGSVAAVVGLTVFWDGIIHGLLFGVGGLWSAAWIYQALPAISGRVLYSLDLARRHRLGTAVGVGATSLLLVGAGVIAGYSWTGGSFSGVFTDQGGGWAETSGIPGLLMGLAILTTVVTVIAQTGLALNIYRTLTVGTAGLGEVLRIRNYGQVSSDTINPPG